MISIPVLIFLYFLTLIIGGLVFYVLKIVQKKVDHSYINQEQLVLALHQFVGSIHRVVDVSDQVFQRLYPEEIPLNTRIEEKLDTQDKLISDLLLKLSDYESLKDEVKGLQGRLSANSIGKAFTPHRKG